MKLLFLKEKQKKTYSYSFQGSVEFICISATVSLFFVQNNAVAEKKFPQEWFNNSLQLQMHDLMGFRI